MANPADIPEQFATLISEDQMQFRISFRAMRNSTVLTEMCDYLEINEAPIPMRMNGETLQLIVDWCERHQDAPIPEEPIEEIPEAEDQWFTEANMDNKKLFDLAWAADFLNVKLLVEYITKKIALMAEGKTAEELQVLFQIPDVQ